MSRSDIVALLALGVAAIALLTSLGQKRQERHLLILEQRNAVISRGRTMRGRLESAREQIQQVLELPLPKSALDASGRQRFTVLVKEIGDQIKLLESIEPALLMTGNTVRRATHANAVSIMNVLHNADMAIQSSEPLLEGCSELFEFSKGLANRNRAVGRSA
jgi:hypothetical protein